MSRTKKSTLNLSLGILNTGLTLVIGFVVTPLLLRWLGQERFGAFRALQDWISYTTIFEYGLGGALIARFAVAVGKNDIAATRKLIVAGLRLYLRITLLVLAIGMIWVIGLPWWVRVETLQLSELRLGGFILIFIGALTPLTVFRWLADAQQRSYVVSGLLAVQSLITSILLLCAAWVGWGLVGQSLVTTITAVFIPVCLLGEALYRFPGLFKEPTDQETIQDIQSLNGPAFIFNCSVRFSILTDNIVIAWAMGAGAVSSFFLTQRLASIALTQLQGIGNATWAGLIELHVQENHSVFRKRLLELTNLVSTAGLCVLVPIAIYNPHFVQHWVGAENFAGTSVSLLACLNAWLWGIFSLWGWPISGTGNLGKWTPYAIAAMVLNLIVSIIGVLQLGFIGPLLGTTIGFICVYSWAMPVVMQRIFHVQPLELWKSAATPLLWGVPYAVLVWGLARRYPPQDWIELLFSLGLAALLGALGWWALGINGESRSLWMMRLRLALGK